MGYGGDKNIDKPTFINPFDRSRQNPHNNPLTTGVFYVLQQDFTRLGR